jgi:Transposase and inactivated derivatives
MNFRFNLSPDQRQELHKKLKQAEQIGDVRWVKRILAILALADGLEPNVVASTLKVSLESIRLWLRAVLIHGIKGITPGKSPGRPAKLTKTERRELADMIDAGPQKAGFSGGCWRSPMIQYLIFQKFGASYSVKYINQLLDKIGFSYQKARFESDHLNPSKRQEWLEKTWPEALAVAKQKNACLLFGDEASFPQWGTLTYTWARKGQQPTVKTSGKRKGYKVFGLIDYFTGKFFSKCQEDRLNSESYSVFLRSVLSQTTQHIVLIQDGARYHTSAAMKTFFEEHKDRLTVFQLSSYSPDFNPIEKLWKKVKEKETHLCHFPTFQDLKDKVDVAMLRFQNLHTEILSLFGMYEKMEVAA